MRFGLYYCNDLVRCRMMPISTGDFLIKLRAPQMTLTMLMGTASMTSMAALAHGLGHTYHWSFVVFVRIVLTFILALMVGRYLNVRPIFFGPRALWTRSIFGTISIACNFYAITHLSVTDALTLLKTSPIWVSIIVAVLNKRAHTVPIWCATAIGFAGVVLMEQPRFDGHLFPILLALCAAVFIACAQVSMTYLKHLPTISIVTHFSGCATLFTFSIFLYSHTWAALPLPQLDWTTGRWLLLMAAFGTLGQVWITTAFRKGNPLLMALVSLCSIPLAATYDYFVWDRTLDMTQAAGIALIVLSIVICSRETIKQRTL